MGDVCVIVCMDWLSRFRGVINCERQLVIFRDPRGGVFIIYGEGTRVGFAFCFAVRARQCLQHGCLDYLAYVVDMRVKRKRSVSDVLFVRDFPDVFSR